MSRLTRNIASCRQRGQFAVSLHRETLFLEQVRLLLCMLPGRLDGDGLHYNEWRQNSSKTWFLIQKGGNMRLLIRKVRQRKLSLFLAKKTSQHRIFWLCLLVRKSEATGKGSSCEKEAQTVGYVSFCILHFFLYFSCWILLVHYKIRTFPDYFLE